MKSNNSIYAFFVFLSLLFWNPLVFYVVYRNTPVITIKFWWLFIAVLFAGGLVLIYFIRKNKLGEKAKNRTLTVAFTLIFLGLAIMADGLIAKPVKKTAEGKVIKKEGLIFEPNSTANYQSTEFNYTAQINSLGLREREIDPDKKGAFRIACFGDSWTFGWGVALEDSWPHRLELLLKESGYSNVEVINCGQAGQYSRTYLKNMRSVLPVLKPDLVLVGLLQGDDLAQLYETHGTFRNQPKAQKQEEEENPGISAKVKYIFTVFLQSSFRNTLEKVKESKRKPIEIKDDWISQAEAIRGAFNPLQQLRFSCLEDTVQQLFITGNLNPGLLHYYINFPDRNFIFNNPSHPATVFAINELKQDVADMKTLCDSTGAALSIISMPANQYTGHQVIRTPMDHLDTWVIENNKIDSIYRSVAETNGLPYIEMTAHFKNLENKSGYFFLFDGHPNEKGYKEIAAQIAVELKNRQLIKK